MATYGYKAITKAGKEVKGSLEADNKDLAMAELRRQELTVIDLGEQSFLTKDIDIQIGGWPKARDLSVMCRQFVSMTKAGVSILESLKMLCEQTENKRLQDALKEVRISVEKGETLADSLAEHPKVFPAIMVNMVSRRPTCRRSPQPKPCDSYAPSCLRKRTEAMRPVDGPSSLRGAVAWGALGATLGKVHKKYYVSP